MPSKHGNAGLLIKRGLYDNVRSFSELEKRISALGDENSKTVGDAFEIFVEGYVATHQKLQAETVWLVRSEFWAWYIFVVIVLIVFGAINGSLYPGPLAMGPVSYVTMAIVLGLILPSLAVSVR
jgi:hypothetical protein